MKMEIKTGNEIYLQGEDMKEANKKSGYDDKTTKDRSDFDEKEWVVLTDYKTLLSLANEMFEQLELMDYEKKAKETYDEFKEELGKM